MIRTIYYSPDGEIEVNPPPEIWKQVFEGTSGFLWFDIVEEDKDASQKLFQEIFGFHPLVIEDALEETHVPKVNSWEGYLYLVLHAVDSSAIRESVVISKELDVFFSERYLVTYQANAIPLVETLWHMLRSDKRVAERGPGYLLYILASEFVQEYLRSMTLLEEEIDLLEEQIFDNPQQSTMERIFDVRRTVLALQRVFGPQREVFNKLSRGEYYMIRDRDRVYFRDIYDHMIRLHDFVESQRDLLNSTMELYLSMANSRLNEIVKALTLFTVLFLPLIFVTGFFGMNFFQPMLAVGGGIGRTAFIAVLLLLVGSPVAMFLWMRNKRWL